ncbi:hypothetical protein HN682_02485, partial [Candidatus Peregrinibacteria bacterium]|nr:hypothetical protein [Candidatus Peregrinibacteria bacterium]
MKIEQINHWLTKVFVVALVLLSGLVFVTSRAAFNNIHQLPIQFILENDSFVAGEQVLLQAIIDGDHDFNSVYFIIRDENQALELQFQAYLENNNIWAADSTWDTTNVIPGGYYLSATATAYGSDGTIMEFASSNDHLFTIIENTSVPPEEEEEEETDTPPLNDPQIDPLVVANIVYPVTQSIISGNNAPLEVILNRSLQDTEVLGASLYNIDGNLMEDHQLSVSSSDNLIYQGHLGNTTQYEDGDYYVVFWLDAATNYLTDPIVFVIQNQEEEEEEETTVPPEEEEENNSGAVTDPIDYAITLEQPSTTIIENNDLIIQLFTNFIAADVGFLFTKADDPSIGVEFSLQNIDGQHWSQVITLDNTFINGDYILTVISIDANGVVFQEIFNFVVNLPILDPPEDNGVSQFFINDYDFADVACYQTYEQSVDPEDWTIGVEALSGEVSELSEMYTLNDVYNEFRITYTSDTAMEVVMYVCNPSSPAFGTGAIFEISANHDNEPHFMWELPASSQPSTFCNWNCGDIEEGVPEEDQDENADPNVPQPEDDGDDNQEEGDDVPEEDEPISCQTDVDCVNLCSGCYHQDDAPVIDCAGLPYGDCSCVEGQCTHIDSNDDPEIEVMDNVDIDQFCLDAGIENESDCAHWLAMLSGDIDQLCLAENIYDATACED